MLGTDAVADSACDGGAAAAEDAVDDAYGDAVDGDGGGDLRCAAEGVVRDLAGLRS